MEVHGSRRLRPGEINVLLESFRCRDSVLKCPFVEHVGRELRKAGVHAVLDLESNGSIAEEDESLKEGLGKSCSGGFLVHDRGAELRMICRGEWSWRGILRGRSKGGRTSDHDELFDTECEGNHAFGLSLQGDNEYLRNTECRRRKRDVQLGWLHQSEPS